MPYTGTGAEVVAAVLRARFPGVPVTVGAIPANLPDVRIGVYDGVPQPQGRNLATGKTWSNPGVQVRFRAGGGDAGYSRAARQARAAREFLVTLYDFRVDVPAPDGPAETAHVAALSVPSDPVYLGVEPGGQNGRQLFVINLTLAYRETA